MSVAGYLSKSGPKRRMPKNCSEELGARFEGRVLTGEKPVEERLTGDTVGPYDEHYECIEEYDTVLRAHCRL
jgi:hypothetical protein